MLISSWGVLCEVLSISDRVTVERRQTCGPPRAIIDASDKKLACGHDRAEEPPSPDRHVVDAEGGDERDVGGGAKADEDRLAGEAEEIEGPALDVGAGGSLVEVAEVRQARPHRPVGVEH